MGKFRNRLKGLAILVVLLAGQNLVPPNESQQPENPQVKSSSALPEVPTPLAESVPKMGGDKQRESSGSPFSIDYWREAIGPAYASNWVLALLGVIGGIVAIGSLISINRQVTQMKSQTEILKDSVCAAKQAADAAKISADIAAGVSMPKLAVCEFGVGSIGAASVEAFFQYPKIKISIGNYGQTPAFLKWWSICFTCEELPDTPIYKGPGCGIILEKVIVKSGEIYTLPELFFPHRQEFSLEDVKAIVDREKWFHAYGYICYGDVFGGPLRRLKFCESVLNIYGTEAICDWWEGVAPPEYSGIDQLPGENHKGKLTQ